MKHVLLSAALLTVAGALQASCCYAPKATTKSCSASGDCDGRKVETRCDSCPCKDDETNKSGECCKGECLCDEEGTSCPSCQEAEECCDTDADCTDCDEECTQDCGDCSAE